MIRKLWLVLVLWPSLALSQVPFQFPAPQSPITTPITQGVSGTTSLISATIVGDINRWTYLCGFLITSANTSPTVAVSTTISGINNPLALIYDYPAAGSQGLLGVAFPQCLVSSAKATSITITLPGSGGTGTVDALSMWGFLN